MKQLLNFRWQQGLGGSFLKYLIFFYSFSNATWASNYEYRFRPVGVVKVGNQILAVDYRFIWGINSNGEIKQLPVLCRFDLCSTKYSYLSSINPAGIFYDQPREKLYIANYQNKNILVGKVLSTHFEVESIVENDSFVSPEGVAVENDLMAVADYDANAVFVFDTKGVLLRRIELPLAHGVAIKGRTVFATGLGGISLVRIDIDKIENPIVSATTMHYPTTVHATKDGVAVLDANAAALQFFDDGLNYSHSISFGHGPTFKQLLRPYGFYLDNDIAVIADTYKHRIVRASLNHEFFDEVSSINKTITIGGMVGDLGLDGCFSGVIDLKSSALYSNQFGTSVNTCWQGIKITTGDKIKFVPLPSVLTRPLGLVWLMAEEDYLVFGAPESSYFYIIDTRTQGKCFFVDLPTDLSFFPPISQNDKSLVRMLSETLVKMPAPCLSIN